jgi:HAD superfamily hydrolase (TIGR01509 family)
VDSEEYHWLAWRETMSAEKLPLSRAEFLATFGQRNDSILTRWLGADVTPERMQKVGDSKEESYRRLVRERGLAPLAGAAEWVKRLKEAGWLQAVASSAPRANIEAVLEVIGLAAGFQATVAAEDVRHGKPAPDVFLTAAARLGAPPARCVVVEDAPAGVEAARRAGMHSIGVGPKGSSLGADIVAPSLAALAEDAFRRLLHEG